MKKTLFVALFVGSTSAMAGVVPIMNSADSFGMSDVSKAWEGKAKSVTMVENAAQADAFYSDVLKQDKKRVEGKLKRKIFSGRIAAPKNMNSDNEVVDYIANNPGSIGYIDEASVSGNVKAIK